MGSRALLIGFSLYLILLSSANDMHAQCCAVGGSSRVKIYNREKRSFDYVLEGITVQVDGRDIKDSTNKDGVYVLYVPQDITRFDLRFSHGNTVEYLYGINNKEAQNKIPDEPLSDVATIKNVETPEELEQRAQYYKAAVDYASTEKNTALLGWATTKLRTLRDIGMELRAEAAAEAKRQRNSTSELPDRAAVFRLYERAILFQKAAGGSQSHDLAETYEAYSDYLRLSGEDVKARMYAQLALQIKGEHFQKPRLSGDDQFALNSAYNAMLERELARLAVERGASDSIKQFGQRLVDSKNQFVGEITQIANGKGMTLPTQLNAKDEAMISKLSTLLGESFDREFLKIILANLQRDISLSQKQADQGTDLDFKGFATRTLPELQEHLFTAQKLKGNLK